MPSFLFLFLSLFLSFIFFFCALHPFFFSFFSLILSFPRSELSPYTYTIFLFLSLTLPPFLCPLFLYPPSCHTHTHTHTPTHTHTHTHTHSRVLPLFIWSRHKCGGVLICPLSRGTEREGH